MLEKENLERLVELVSEELRDHSHAYHERLDSIDAEIAETRERLGRLYDALETGKLELDDLADRIKELRGKREQLESSRYRYVEELEAHSRQVADVETFKSYAGDLTSLLEEGSVSERRAFIKSFVGEIDEAVERLVTSLLGPEHRDRRQARIPDLDGAAERLVSQVRVAPRISIRVANARPLLRCARAAGNSSLVVEFGRPQVARDVQRERAPIDSHAERSGHRTGRLDRDERVRTLQVDIDRERSLASQS